MNIRHLRALSSDFETPKTNVITEARSQKCTQQTVPYLCLSTGLPEATD